jgi:hypothetical protein
MLDLENKNFSWILAPITNIGLESYLYSMGYHIINIKNFFNGEFKDAMVAFIGDDSDKLRSDSLHLIKHFSVEYLYIKYFGDTDCFKLLPSGEEYPYKWEKWNTDPYKITFIHSGLSFSFSEQKRWYKPKEIGDFKIGMTVECFSDGKWIRMMVKNPQSEWNDIYKLMIKWDKIRICS